jgi:hypothetical protein
MTEVDIARGEARRAVLWSSVLNFSCGVMGTLAFRQANWLPMWAMVQFAISGGVVFLVALLWRGARRPVYLGLFSLNVASALLTSLAGANAFAFVGQVGEVYQSLKAGLVVIAVLSPSLRLGAAWIGVFAVAPIVQAHLWEPTIRNAIPAWEPWFVPIYGAIALVLLLYRRRSMTLQNELAETRAERLAIERLAGVTLAVRDLANTPLQTLTTGVGLLRHNVPDSDRVLASMERALSQLAKLRLALAPFEREWQPADESFDALARVERLASELPRAK